jgi:endonuclease YncB( thermonuclease family)
LNYITVAVLATAAGLALAPGATAAPASAADLDCADFSSQRAAQLYFLRHGGPGSDPDRLDADNDGIACDANPCPCYYGRSLPESSPTPSPAPRPQPRPRPRNRRQTIKSRIIDVVDGDTIKVRTLEPTRKPIYTVRLIGIDTPETRKPGTPVECGGREATSSAFRWSFERPRDTDGDHLVDTRGGLGRRVVLVTDPSQGLYDRYHRLLAYVTLRDGASLNVFQIGRGWSRVYVFRKPFTRLAAFRKAQKRASRRDLGAWALCSGHFHTPAKG